MRFPPQFLDELSARLPVSEVVGRRVKLKQGRARVEGAFAVQPGEDAVVLRQRPEAGVVRFLLRQERRHLRLRDGDRGPVVPRSGRAARRAWPAWRCRKCRSEAEARERAPQDAARCGGARGEILRGDACRARRRQGARLSRRPRPRSGDAAQVPHRLCAGRALRAQGASRRAGRFGRGHGRGRACWSPATTSRCPTTASATA